MVVSDGNNNNTDSSQSQRNSSDLSHRSNTDTNNNEVHRNDRTEHCSSQANDNQNNNNAPNDNAAKRSVHSFYGYELVGDDFLMGVMKLDLRFIPKKRKSLLAINDFSADFFSDKLIVILI